MPDKLLFERTNLRFRRPSPDGEGGPPNGGGRGDFSQQKAFNKAVCDGFSTLPPAYAGPPSLSRDGLRSHIFKL